MSISLEVIFALLYHVAIFIYNCVMLMYFSDAIRLKQSKVDKLYASLKDLASERKGTLDEVLKLYMLHREIDDLEQWINEREIIAGQHELGQNFEHVTVSL